MPKKLQVGQILYLKKENTPMGLTIGDEYGSIIDINGLSVLVKKIDGALQWYVNDGKKSVFQQWLTTKK